LFRSLVISCGCAPCRSCPSHLKPYNQPGNHACRPVPQAHRLDRCQTIWCSSLTVICRTVFPGCCSSAGLDWGGTWWCRCVLGVVVSLVEVRSVSHTFGQFPRSEERRVDECG